MHLLSYLYSWVVCVPGLSMCGWVVFVVCLFAFGFRLKLLFQPKKKKNQSRHDCHIANFEIPQFIAIIFYPTVNGTMVNSMNSENFQFLAINGGACNFLVGKRWVDFLLLEALGALEVWYWAFEIVIQGDWMVFIGNVFKCACLGAWFKCAMLSSHSLKYNFSFTMNAHCLPFTSYAFPKQMIISKLKDWSQLNNPPNDSTIVACMPNKQMAFFIIE